ncbi:MAG: glycosyltransferase, partial [Paracoccaceae bacterium]
MRAPVSVIIPTLNAESALPTLLSSLFEGLDAAIIREVIVADGGSRDATVDMAEKVGCHVEHCAKGRGGQIRQGISVAKGDWVLILHADSVLGSGWSEGFERYLEDPATAWYFTLKFNSDHPMARLTAGWANRRARLLGLPYGDQGLLVNRT